ncbi:MAG TPA: acetylglutamate kinase [Clostridiales bacterium]|jgi:hypothetical protein|nr:acetylglutamate kinase [Clostridiales bacterium]
MRDTNNLDGLDSCQLRLSNTFRELWVEHVLWTRLFIISAIFDLPDLQFTTERLLRNPVDFAKVLKPFYGEKTAMQFERLLTDHLLIAAQLVNASKAGDAEQVDKQRRRWYMNAEDIAKFLACINCFWSEAEWKKLLFDHLRMTEDEAVLILTGQYEKSIKIYDQIQTQALKMADVMTRGIIRQFGIM